MSRTRTFVSTAVSRVIDDDILNDVAQTSLITAVLREESITDHLLDGILEGTGSKVRRALEYARNDYIYGLPQHTFINSTIAQEEAQDVIEQLIGAPIIFEYHRFGELNGIHLGLQELVDNYGYIEASNEIKELTLLEGAPVYLELIQVIISTVVTDDIVDQDEIDGSEFADLTANDQTSFEADTSTRFTPWDNPFFGTPQYRTVDSSGNRVIINYAFSNAGVITRKTITIELDQYNDDSFYVQSKFNYLNGNVNTVGYFTYENNTGTYPSIDNSVGVSDSTGEFLPVAFFIHNNENVADLVGEPEYETTKELIDLLGYDYDDMSEQIQENPDIDLVQEGVLTFGIPTTTNNALGRKYVGEFFIWLFENEGAGSSDVRSLIIQDGEFRQRIEYANMVSTVHQGFAVTSPERSKPGDVFTFSVEIDGIPVLQVFKQVTANQYIELVVNDLQMAYFVDGQDVYVSADDREDRLLIPINYDLIQEHFQVLEADNLLSQSIHLIFNSKITKKIKWYETGIFKVLLTVVAIVATVITVGQAAPAIYAAYTAYAVAYGALVAAVIIAIQFIGFNIAVKYAYSFVAENIGGENAFFAAVIGIGLSVFAITANPTLAPDLLQQSVNLLEASNEQIGNEILEFQEDGAQFALDSEQQITELDESRAELGLGDPTDIGLLDAFRLIPEIRPSESPDQLYARTVGSGNIGTVAYDYIENFAEFTLRLPTIEESIEQFKRTS